MAAECQPHRRGPGARLHR